METINIKFLNQAVSLPTDIQEYRKILKMSIKAHQEMFEIFTDKVLKTERKAIEDEELISILKPQAEKFVKCLCDKGIFSQTINDYIIEIPGYSDVLATNQRALQATFDFLREEVMGFVHGVEEAERSAQSKVTGSGISVWSNSFTTLASFAALDYFSAKGQLKEANTEYKKEIEQLEKYGKTQTERKTLQYLKAHYFPEMEEALGVFAFGMMDRYLSTLIKEKHFDESVLQYVDLKRSNDLLDNLKLSYSIEKILENAFVACPFNVKVFVAVAQHDKLDNSMVQVIQDLKMDDEIMAEYTKLLENARRSEPDYNFVSLLEKAEPIICLLAKLKKKDMVLYYKEFSLEVYNKIIARYNEIKRFSDGVLTEKILSEISIEEISSLTPNNLQSVVQKQIDNIVDKTLFDILIFKCGYNTLLIDIYPNNSLKFATKNDVDSFYVSTIVNILMKDFDSVKKELVLRNKYELIKIKLTDQNIIKIKTELKSGQKLNAIKIVCESTGAGLAEAKEYVEKEFKDLLPQNSNGCYIATCVYGSYDCPSVWTLRRYRDYKLATSRSGRTFIRIYYAISPKIVKCFGKSRWFKSLWRKKLDKIVNKLQAKGLSCEPYNDKKW